MTKQEKATYVDELAADLAKNNIIYLTDTAELTVEAVNNLRRRAFGANVSMRVVKNTLLAKAMDRVEDKDFGDLVFQARLKHCGVLLVRFDECTFDEKCEMLTKVLENYKEALPYKFAVYQDHKIRIR